MRLYSFTRELFWLLVLLIIVFALLIAPARAADSSLSISINFGYDQFGSGNYKEFDSVPLGKSMPLSITIVNNGPNPVRVDSLKCLHNGTSLSASSISRLPNSVVFAANAVFTTEQFYRAVAPGLSEVTCAVSGMDTVTHASLVAVSPQPAKILVSGETRLTFHVSSATRNTVTVGQRMTVMAVYGNRGNTTLTNVSVTCGKSNHGFSIALYRQTQTTLPPGQSGFAEFVAVGGLVGGGALIQCSITAVDSSTGATIGLSSTPFIVSVVG